MNKLDAVKLQQLADLNFWDIEILWDRFDLDIKVLERFDAEGFIELREVGLYQDSNTTMRTKEGPWYSPLSKSKSWSYYFPRDNDDRKMRTSSREIFPPEQRLIFTMFNSAPVEVRVTETGRRALVEKDSTQLVTTIATVDAVVKPKPTQTIVLWPGAEPTPHNIRIARSRTAILESGGNVKEAHKLLSREGNGIALVTLYGHIKILNKEDRGWNSGIISKQLGNLENGVSPRTKGKQRGS